MLCLADNTTTHQLAAPAPDFPTKPFVYLADAMLWNSATVSHNGCFIPTSVTLLGITAQHHTRPRSYCLIGVLHSFQPFLRCAGNSHTKQEDEFAKNFVGLALLNLRALSSKHPKPVRNSACTPVEHRVLTSTTVSLFVAAVPGRYIDPAVSFVLLVIILSVLLVSSTRLPNKTILSEPNRTIITMIALSCCGSA
ncbi:hypothetical protein HYDPIDRAFT_106077, partial [Hydnomerulius pinastri MD-312]